MAKKSKKRLQAPADEPQEAVLVETEAPESGNDNTLVRNVIILVLVLIGLYLLFSVVSGQNDQENGDNATDDETSQVESPDEDRRDGEAQEETEAATSQNQTVVNETDAAYSYTVGAGESYTTIARQAIASLESDLTSAERVAAETKLATEAASSWLDVGQNVTLEKDTVRVAIDWAKALSDGQKVAWQPYADSVAW